MSQSESEWLSQSQGVAEARASGFRSWGHSPVQRVQMG